MSWCDTGGGRECTQTLSNIAGIALSVLWHMDLVNGQSPPFQPIPVERAFQILGVDIMDLPKTERGSQHVVVFQDFLTKWPMAFPVPDQKAIRITHLLADEVIPNMACQKPFFRIEVPTCSLTS